MSEIKETVELKDEELDKVTGGGSGTIPQGGITFEKYDTLQSGYYYSYEQNFNEVAYVYTTNGKLYYTSEKFLVDPATNSWISRSITPSGVIKPIENVEGFMYRYKYKLNVQPK